MSDVDSAIATLAGSEAGATALPESEQTTETTQVEEPGFGDDRPQGAEQDGEQQEPQEDTPAEPGKVQTRDVVKTLRELRQSHPEAEAHLRDANDALFQRDRYREAFNTVEEAVQTKTRLEAMGGWDGIREHQANTARLSELNAMADAGDPKVAEAFVKESPQGLIKLLPHFLEGARKIDSAAYGRALAPVVRQSLVDSGVLNLMSRMAYWMENGNSERAQEEAASIGHWVKQVEQIEHDARRTQDSPEIQAARRDQQEAAKVKADALDARINAEIVPWLGSQSDKALSTFLKAQELKGDPLTSFKREVGARVSQALASDSNYQANIRALRASGDVSRIVRYIQGEAQAVVPKAVAELWKERGYRATAPRPAQKAGTTPTGSAKPPISQGLSFVPEKPQHDQIDWSKDPDRTLFITGRAYLKNGKFVTWRKPS